MQPVSDHSCCKESYAEKKQLYQLSGSIAGVNVSPEFIKRV